MTIENIMEFIEIDTKERIMVWTLGGVIYLSLTVDILYNGMVNINYTAAWQMSLVAHLQKETRSGWMILS